MSTINPNDPYNTDSQQTEMQQTPAQSGNFNPVRAPIPQNRELTLGKWVLTLFLLSIPVVNLVMLIIWGFGDEPTSRKTFSRAYLIWMAISTVISIIFLILYIVFIYAMFSSGSFGDIFRQYTNYDFNIAKSVFSSMF